MSIQVITNFEVNNPNPIDSRMGPYASANEATASISELFRYVGQTVIVTGSGAPVEYWFYPTTASTDLVVKSSAGTPGGSDTQIQFNSGSAFSGSAAFRYIYASQSLEQGEHVQARGQYSFAQGGGLNEFYATIASGSKSHAEGFRTIAQGEASHAEGNTTQAVGQYSHAEGFYVQAIGEASHAEGRDTQAIGNYSHAEGHNTKAIANYSHAAGYYTVASGSYQSVIGQYNISSSAQSAFIIGNGGDDNNRSNLLFASGSQVQITGSLNVNGTSRFRDTVTISNNKYIQFEYTVGTGGFAIKQDTSNRLVIDNGNYGYNAVTIVDNPAISSSVGLVGIFTQNPTSTLDVSGSGRFTQFVTASKALFSGSGTNQLTVVGSGSSQPLMQVIGSQGELFTVTDSLSGSLFSVNDISGLPVIEAFSDSTVLIGSYQAPALNTTVLLPNTTAGVNTIYTVPTSSYDAVYVDYVIRSGSVGRAGTFTAMWSGSSTSIADISVTPFGDTSGFVFGANVTGSDLLVSGSCATAGWRVKTIIRSI